MSASRASSVRALKQLTASTPKQQTRSLRMCEPRAYHSRLLASQHGNAIAGASSETRVAGDHPNPQLNDPLNLSPASRTMTTIATTKPSATGRTMLSGPAKPYSRTFNTSRALKSPNDTSTMDFAFLPMEAGVSLVSEPALRVPILPHVVSSLRQVIESDAAVEKVHVSEINTISGASTYAAAPSALSELHDNESLAHDYHAVADGLKVKNAEPTEDGILKSLWQGMVDDVLGAKGKAVSA